MSKSRISYYIILCFAANFLFASCEDYLDKAPEAGLTSDEIFESFEKFQGFIEEGYFFMEDPSSSAMTCNFNFGDDLLMPNDQWFGTVNGNYRSWETCFMCIFYNTAATKYIGNVVPNSGVMSQVGYWDGGWCGIRKMNMALANIDKLVIPYKDAPLQEQKDLIVGQALFLRAYFYFNIIRAWGGMPYITKVFEPNEPLNYPRLSYAECSDSIEKDLLGAIDKLPVEWDSIATGQITKGTNQGRLTKGAAYALLGKVMLYAGSPLMNGASNGPGGYAYNKEYCKKSVKYFGEILKLSAITGGKVYDLLPWDKYSTNFYTNNRVIPSTGKEAVLCSPILGRLRNVHLGDYLQSMGGWGVGCGPLENYVEYFGMEDGENFNPAVYSNPSINPWARRDPRFYKNIVVDGSTLMYNAAGNPKANPAQFYVGGRDRGSTGKSATGYGWQKYRDSTIYASHPSNGWSASIFRRVPVIRLADVYLMYAEAVNEAYGHDVSPSNVDPMQTCNIKAWEAVLAVRDRIVMPDGMPLPLPEHLYASDEALRETIRRERAVELAFEGHRWYDIRRWYVADQPEYMKLDVLDFDKEHTYYKVRSYGKKIFEKKHYWLPIKNSQTRIYPEFQQNPGW